MPAFIVIGRKVCTDGRFSLNDLTGSTGRLDILLRCINSSFMLSHDIRRDVELYLVLQGEPDSPKTLLFRGSELKYLNPDERATAALVKNALMLKNLTGEWKKSTPGILAARLDFPELLERFGGRRIVYLKEDGQPMKGAVLGQDDIFVLGNVKRTVEVNLTDRSSFNYPLLIGAKALREFGAAVNPARRYTADKPDC